jgi:uncharacterized membrane protein YphA (DoxX/SURF4 family)
MLAVVAHVTYITEDEPSPDPIGFLLAVLSEPASWLWLGGGAVLTVAVLAAWYRLRPLESARLRFVGRAESYRHYVPWMVRLAVGLVLIGAGLNRVVCAPTIELAGWPYLLLTAVGFLLLLGFAVRLAALVGLALYGVALLLDPSVLLIFDVAGGLAAAAVLGPGAPSLDDLLRAAFPRGPGGRLATLAPASQRYGDVVPLLLRIGLGGAFAASGVLDKLFIYERSLAVVDHYHLTAVIPAAPGLWVVGATLIETSLGIAILLGVLTRLSAVVAFSVLTLTLFAVPDDPVIAHVGLFGLCSILVVLGGGRWSVDGRLARTPPSSRPEAAPKVGRIGSPDESRRAVADRAVIGPSA